MAVQKMRATRVDHTPQPFRFTNNGIAKYRALNIPSKVLQDRIENGKEKLGGPKL
ncbi:MAG: hypothetical protein R2741_09890 [Methanolobus sp.]